MWDFIKDKFDRNQFGTLKGSCTTFALIEILNLISGKTDKLGEYARMLLLDYSKAFDRIDHRLLLEKLHIFGLPEFIINWIADFLTARTQCVKIGDIKSEWLGTKAGVPQGTKLGPVLFILMINDLDTCAKTYKYVDDTTLISCGTKSAQDSLQLATTEAHDWSTNNHMAINPLKTKQLIFDFSRPKLELPVITISGTEIESVNHAKLLGVTISSDLSWEEHVDKIHGKGCQRIHYITLLRRAGISADQLLKIYLSVIRPTLEYACQVWHCGLTVEQSRLLENVQKRVLRKIYPQLTYQDALLEAKIPSLAERRVILCQTMFNKMTDSSHKMHHLLPPVRQSHYATRNSKTYSVPKTRTKRSGRTFLQWALTHCQ